MDDRRYLISEVSQKTGLEAHVLRYWEEELGLNIPRNELGHRYYTGEHIELFNRVKEMKGKGYQLKAIKPQIIEVDENNTVHTSQPQDKMEQFKAIIGEIVTEALRENNGVLQDEMSYKVSDKVIKEMDYLLRLKEETEEERFKRLDETIRNCQKSNKEVAAGRESRKKRRKKGLHIV